MSQPTPSHPADSDRNLLFGILALQADLIEKTQFVEACAAWAARKDTPLAELLVERNWLSPDDRRHLDHLLERKLRKHGDARASLAAVADAAVRDSLADLDDPDVRKSLAALTSPDGTPRTGARTTPELSPPPRDENRPSTLPYVPNHAERYVLGHVHARGGIGRVRVAYDNDLGREVALKELLPEGAEDTQLQARFLNEARITGQLEHPGIVPVYELSRRRDDNQPFYVMRFVKGRTLSRATKDYHEKRRRGEATPLDLMALLNAFVGVCGDAEPEVRERDRDRGGGRGNGRLFACRARFPLGGPSESDS